jgi:NAD(P)-dependent dehydrogenase (short-subunit alcohol dehydrogenase family)
MVQKKIRINALCPYFVDTGMGNEIPMIPEPYQSEILSIGIVK